MADEKKEKAKGNKLTKIIIIVLAVVVIGMGAFIAYNFFFKKNAASNNTEKTTVTATAKQIRLADEKTLGLDEFVVNLADAGRYLKVKIFLGYETNKKLEEEFTTKTPQIRDIVLEVLRSKTSKNFDNKGIDNLKKELIDKINEILINGQLTNIYINDLLIQ